MKRLNLNKRKLAFQNKLFLCFVFALMFSLSFLGFKGMQKLFAINSAYAGFDAGNIMSDYVMSDYTSMSESEIQSFLKSKNSCNFTVSTWTGSWRKSTSNLVTYYREATDPTTWHVTSTAGSGTFVCMANESINGESAAHIIYQAARDYKINPKVLIVLLQKEQGLITDTVPNSFNYRSATGYGCPDSAACSSTYYGFKNQVRNAAKLFRYVLDNGSSYYPVGNRYVKYNYNSSCGGSVVNIQNRATSALYQYTPYQPNAAVLNTNPGVTVDCGAYGNANFYYYYKAWFGDTQKTVTTVNFQSKDTFTMQVGSGKYIVPESNSQGAKLVISSNASEANRQYQLTKSGNFYVITHVASGMVIDLAGADTSNGTSVQIYASNGTDAQKWRFSAFGSGYILHSALSDSKVIDVPGAAMQREGLALHIYDENGTVAQNVTMTDISDAPVEEGMYLLETTGAKDMDIDGGRKNNGTRMLTWNLTHGENQQFTITRSADGLYTVKNVASGRVLDVAGGGTSNGTAVQLYDSNNTCSQKWIVEESGSGYRFLSACSGKAIDIPGGNTSSTLQKLQIYDANNTNAQVWVLRDLQTLEDGEYTISSGVGSDFVVDISGGASGAKSGTNIQIYTANGTTAQTFKVKYDSKAKAYSIVNEASGYSLDVAGASSSAGANVQVWNSNSTCAQFWHLHPNSDGTYDIISACSDKVLDVAGGVSKNGSNVQVYSYNNTKAQKWTFKKIETTTNSVSPQAVEEVEEDTSEEEALPKEEEASEEIEETLETETSGEE